MASKQVRRFLGESIEKFKGPVMDVKEASRPVTYHVCPHCNEEIHEKATYGAYGGLIDVHRPCGGMIEFPEQVYDSSSDLFRAIQPHMNEMRKLRQEARGYISTGVPFSEDFKSRCKKSGFNVE